MKQSVMIVVAALSLSACGANIQWCDDPSVSCAPATTSSTAMDDLQRTIENNRNWDKNHCGNGYCNHLGGYTDE